MKLLSRTQRLSLIFVLLLLLLPSFPVYAAEGTDELSLEAQLEALVEETVPSYSTVALGYKNTVTGEEHYVNGDAYMIGASLYKTPLNMIYAERIYNGEMSFDDCFEGMTYREMQSASLTYSSNPPSVTLLMDSGDWSGMRLKCAEYLGEDPADQQYLARTNRFSAREMVHCMDLLQRESDRFPGVLDCLLPSAPGLFLKYGDPDIPIAQKYGNLFEDITVLNAAGIIYTEEPIAVCVMTCGYTDSNTLFSGFVRIVTEYTNRDIAARKASEAAEKERLQREEQERKRSDAEQTRLDEHSRQLQEQKINASAMAEKRAEISAAKRRHTFIWLFGALALVFLMTFLRRKHFCFLLPLFFLPLLFLSLSAGDADTGEKLSPVSLRTAESLEQARIQELQGLAELSVHYTVDENATSGPKPCAGNYGTAQTFSELSDVLSSKLALSSDEPLLLSAETELKHDSIIRYYSDETILALVWQEQYFNCLGQSVTGTFAEIKLADGSQLRRKLGDDCYGSSIQKFPTELAAECNAVIALNGDFYRFQNTGIHVYNRTVYASDGSSTDSCFINGAGDLLMVPSGTLTNKTAVEQYVNENDILFGVSFGPIMIRDGVNTVPEYYWMGQARDNYPRCALCQLGNRHYLAATFHAGASVQEAANWLMEKSVRNAYAMDGGQSAVIILNGELCNPMDQYSGSQRTMSDIIYFCTALPEGEGFS